MKNLIVKFLLPFAGAALLSACGDDITEVNMAGRAGIGQVASFGELPECTAGNVGEMLYATDSAKVYYCADSVWATLNGKDGSAGRDGENGSGCTADSTAKGIVVVCGGDTVGTILNGKNGFDGKDGTSSVDTLVVSKSDTLVVIDTVLGLDGSSCTAEALDDGSGYRIVCGGDSVGVILNGKDGKDGADGKDGLAKVPEGDFSCSEYDCVTTAYLNPAFEYGELLDARDNKVYRTIEIGSQVWMAQNLDFYDSSDATLRGQTHCYYDSLAFCETYGRLYTWSAAMGFDSAYNSRLTEEGMIGTPHRGICPEGFHLPSDAEWATLGAYVDAHNGAEGVGTSLKARYLWRQDSTNIQYNEYNGITLGTDLFGWAGLPGDNYVQSESVTVGGKKFTGFDGWVGFHGEWTSSTETQASLVEMMAVIYAQEKLNRGPDYKNRGYSVRCVKD